MKGRRPTIQSNSINKTRLVSSLSIGTKTRLGFKSLFCLLPEKGQNDNLECPKRTPSLLLPSLAAFRPHFPFRRKHGTRGNVTKALKNNNS
jgi:hypothetical protein